MGSSPSRGAPSSQLFCQQVTTNYKEFSKQRGAIITALLPTGDHQLQRVLQAEGRHHHSSFANRRPPSSQTREEVPPPFAIQQASWEQRGGEQPGRRSLEGVGELFV